MNVVYVGVGEMATSRKPEQIVKTLALGSCVAVVMLDPQNKTVGLLHVALPDSSINKKRALERPGMFADTGLETLMENMKNQGFLGGRLVVKLVGGASVMDPNNTFNIGKRNILSVKKTLWKYKLGALSEDVGGSISRSVAINVKTGKVVISSPGRGDWEI